MWLVQGAQRSGRWPGLRMDGAAAETGVDNHFRTWNFTRNAMGSYCRTVNRAMTSSDTFPRDQLLLYRGQILQGKE